MLEHGNHEYSTYYNQEYTHVYKLEDCVRAILCRNKNNEDRIKYLEEQSKKLKEESYKDEELQNMKQQLDQMKADYYRGFPITEKEKKSIDAWMEKHENKVHSLAFNGIKMKARCSYSYHFVPTELGTSGVIRCNCGEEFEFQEIG